MNATNDDTSKVAGSNDKIERQILPEARLKWCKKMSVKLDELSRIAARGKEYTMAKRFDLLSDGFKIVHDASAEAKIIKDFMESRLA